MVADIEELEKLDASQNLSQKTECKRSPDITQKYGEFVFSVADGSATLSGRLRIPRTNSETGIHREERESQRRLSRRKGRVST